MHSQGAAGRLGCLKIGARFKLGKELRRLPTRRECHPHNSSAAHALDPFAGLPADLGRRQLFELFLQGGNCGVLDRRRTFETCAGKNIIPTGSSLAVAPDGTVHQEADPGRTALQARLCVHAALLPRERQPE
jgi:hypothetical protein